MAASLSRALLAAVLTFAGTSVARAGEPLALDWHVTPAAVTSQCDAEIARLKQRTSQIAGTSGGGFQSTVSALESATADASDALAPDIFLASVAPDQDVQTAALACKTNLADAFAAIDSDPRLYKTIARAVHRSRPHNVYDAKLSALWLKTFQRAGAGLSPVRHAEYVRLESELNDVQDRFAQNLADASATIELDRRDTAGIPGDLLAAYGRERNGSCRVPVNESTLSFLSYAQDGDARRRFWLAFNDRAAAANVPLFERAIAIRDRLSHLLGYESWADYRLADETAGSLPRAQTFLRNVTASLQPAAVEEMHAMRDAVSNDRHDSSATLQPWDVRRGEYLLRKARSSDSDAVRQYFPAQHTIDAILDIYRELLGVDFERVDRADTWAPGVVEYRVRDHATNDVLGITYFDLYPREHKYGHFATYVLLPARNIDGVRRPPVAAIVGNWPQGGPRQPALLTHADVVTFFHEFGHDMAALLAMAPYETLSNGFRQDFVEAPSQMLENFAWQPEILKRISSHWRTGEPMPDDMIAALIASRGTDEAYETSRMLALSAFDLTAHSSGPHVDSTALFEKTAGTLLPTLYVRGTHPQVAFDHLMSGYDAGLYAYPWARVYAQDLFTAFAGGSLLDPTVGRRYREQILAPARTYEPDVEVARFLGRAVTSNAFFQELGVTRTETHE